MSQKKNICPKLLEDLYSVKKMSSTEIAKFLQSQGKDVKPWIVSRRLRELGMTRTMSQALLVKDFCRPIIDLSEKELEALDGFLLGDGHIQWRSSRSGRLALTVQYAEFGKYLLSHFNRYSPKGRQRYINSARYQKTLSQWSGETKSDRCFLDQRSRWYPQNIKRVPKDVRLTPLSMLLWYLGDGHYASRDRCILLHTQGFIIEDVKFLCSKLSKLGIDCHRDKRNRIYLDAKSAYAFLDILPENPVSCYDYKFRTLKSTVLVDN